MGQKMLRGSRVTGETSSGGVRPHSTEVSPFHGRTRYHRCQLLSGLIRLSHVMNALRRIIFSSFTEPKKCSHRVNNTKILLKDSSDTMTLTFTAVLLFEHTRRKLPEKRDKCPRSGRHRLVTRSLVLCQILKQIRVHDQRTPVSALQKARKRVGCNRSARVQGTERCPHLATRGASRGS